MNNLLSVSERNQELAPLLAAGWQLDGAQTAITKKLKFKNFIQTWGAMTQIALNAEAMDHHPEWSNVYNRLTITLTTHSAAGLTMLDIALAKKIDMIAATLGAAAIID